jgi:hypothetical protein
MPNNNSLRAACAFARIFAEEAEKELQGSSSEVRKHAQIQLSAALYALHREEYCDGLTKLQ